MKWRSSPFDAGDGCFIDCSQTAISRETGILGGISAGYNQQFGLFVAGVEADVSLASVKGGASAATDGFFNSLAGNLSQSVKLNAFSSVRGRLGFTVDRALVYATAGVAFADVQNRIDTATLGNVYSSHGWRSGYAVGGGVEYALSAAWSVKAEALYYNLGSKSAVISASGYSFGYRGKVDGVIGRVGLNFKFGADAPTLSAKY